MGTSLQRSWSIWLKHCPQIQVHKNVYSEQMKCVHYGKAHKLNGTKCPVVNDLRTVLTRTLLINQRHERAEVTKPYLVELTACPRWQSLVALQYSYDRHSQYWICHRIKLVMQSLSILLMHPSLIRGKVHQLGTNSSSIRGAPCRHSKQRTWDEAQAKHDSVGNMVDALKVKRLTNTVVFSL